MIAVRESMHSCDLRRNPRQNDDTLADQLQPRQAVKWSNRSSQEEHHTRSLSIVTLCSSQKSLTAKLHMSCCAPKSEEQGHQPPAPELGHSMIVSNDWAQSGTLGFDIRACLGG